MASLPRAYVINLDRSPERLAVTRARFAPTGLALERFAGIDAAADPEGMARLVDQNRFEAFMYRRALPGEVGCALSHFALWETLADADTDTYLVLEDDAAPSPHFGALSAVLEALPDDWELALLSSRGWRPYWRRQAGPVTVERQWRPNYIAAGYLVNRRILRHRHRWPPQRRLGFMFDSWRYWAWLYGMAIYTVTPQLVLQDTEVASTIVGSGIGRAKMPRTRFPARLKSYPVRLAMYPRGAWHAARAWWRLRGA
ncbi:glycosyltransferase family 25 protein [Aquibium sp. A9E412]|uniref:glycosyltransferase family 25 protein n=1 Tax=Aquibium sp. A9E412 TaxID=2976767 RepID=UPI0025B09AE6|nr:glycosyltransferase family 25 protein [Aquibium sp. A9E412]MDN2568082.1 glycosyltransferase family 25 protein [Aquibium sp. A9E412]